MPSRDSKETTYKASQNRQAETKETSEQIKQELGIEEGNRISTKKIVFMAIALAFLAVAIWIWTSTGGQSGPNYIQEKVTRGELTVIVSATGDLQAVNTVEVGSEISGLIKSVYVDYNDKVQAGQLLAKLDTDRLEAEVAQSRASLQAARATLTQAQASLEEQRTKTRRAEELAGKNLISPQELESAQAALARAQATVASARSQIVVSQAALDMAETTLRKASILSPIDGVVLTTNIKPGQAVAASFQTPVLFTLAGDLGRMELHVDIDEADISQVKDGQQATFTVDAYPDTAFPATITKVYYAPQKEAEVVTYEAILSVDNNKILLRPGMTATTDIVTNRVKDAILVPNSALRFTPPGENRKDHEGSTVWVLKNKMPTAIPVKIGLANDEHTQILSGNLKEGEELLVNIKREE
ncbi:MAG: efflux RND transporter periplasmic adaptor subunit [Balneolaceae bacterium]|jgi:HlyD family secretion protein